MLAQTKHLLGRLPLSADVAVAVVVILAVGMMILPMPHLLVDSLIALNLGFSVLLLMVALYVLNPLDFSSLPGVILISTVFRLALTITTARLILSEGDAGEIIRTFGEFVISGNLIVGIVIFLIITLVQFIVIAKGAERVAEVGARFTLDALPGKQMAIDAELRNGDIDQAQARERRTTLERESQFYGAMDGAMKFVKGDAIAGLVVIAVNMVGGLAIGILTRGLPATQAMHEYSLLSIGDALIAQIPALLVSLTAGIIVTRVTGGGRDIGLGRDIADQLVANPRALRLAAAMLLALAAVPGFPAPVFLVLATIFAGASFAGKFAPAPATDDDFDAETMPPPRIAKPALPAEAPPVALVLSPRTGERMGLSRLRRQIALTRAAISTDLGILVPEVGESLDPDMADDAFRIDVEGVPVASGRVRTDRLLLDDDEAALELSGLPYTRDAESEAVWIDIGHATALDAAGIGYRDAVSVGGAALGEALTREIGRFVGIQETRALLARMEASYGELVKEVLRSVPVPRVADVLRRLLDEGIPLRNTRLVLETLAEWGEREQNPARLTEYVRAGLKRQISHRYANPHKVIAAYIIERETEEAIRDAIQDTEVGPYLALDDATSEVLLLRMRRIQDTERRRPVAGSQERAVVLAAMDIRRFVRGFLVRNGIDIPVLSYQNLADEFTTQPIGTINIADPLGLVDDFLDGRPMTEASFTIPA